MSSQIPKIQYGLAPMEGVTDFATRLWFQLVGGMDFTWTPFLRVTDTFPNKLPENFAPELFALKGLLPAPLKFQVMGSRPEHIVRTSDLLGDLVDSIDLNCGCPSPTVVGSRAGSSLLESVEYFGDFVRFIVDHLGANRLSVKMRTGYHDAKEFPALLAAIKDLSLKYLTVHGRTRPDRYLGQANWNLIEQASQLTSFEIIGSGDITDVSSKKLRQQTAPSIAKVIIGRGALRNPWIFCEAENAPIIDAFVAFVVMQDMGMESYETLVRWAAEYSDIQFGNLVADDWRRVTSSLCLVRGQSQNLNDIQVTPRALSRGKMLWNYLRSSLPEAFMDSRLMRSRSLGELVSGMRNIASQQGMPREELPIKYRAELDWMYSGAGRGVSSSQKRGSEE